MGAQSKGAGDGAEVWGRANSQNRFSNEEFDGYVKAEYRLPQKPSAGKILALAK
jgi:hypothetical protein